MNAGEEKGWNSRRRAQPEPRHGSVRAQGVAVECGVAFSGWNLARLEPGTSQEAEAAWGLIMKSCPGLGDELVMILLVVEVTIALSICECAEG